MNSQPNNVGASNDGSPTKVTATWNRIVLIVANEGVGGRHDHE